MNFVGKRGQRAALRKYSADSTSVANASRFHELKIRFQIACILCILLPSFSLAQTSSCRNVLQAENELLLNWLQLERNYPILYPILKGCNDSANRNRDGGFLVACAGFFCYFSMNDCVNLASEMISLSARQDVIDRQKRQHC
ncbi:MAG: hypothetical protein ING09_17895 [Roseomonas sp.]|nr:hypothetical protein [Roseomonas sp.]MCA3290869.1 hypothetical protein [Roseomonas sp.]MCA3296341.1 hypothetical protein [Roseomonas sp.]